MVAERKFYIKAKYIVNWCILWVSVYAIYDILLKPNKINYQDSPVLLSIYFITISVLGTIYLKSTNQIRAKIINYKILTSMVVLYTLFVAICVLTNYYFSVNFKKLYWFREIGILFPFFTVSATISKSSDIFFQQIFILSFLLKLKEFHLSEKNIILFFGIVFFLVHTPLFISMSFSSFLFIIPSVFGGFIFSYLIVNYKNGFLYSTAVHLFFYYLLGVALRQA